MTSLSIVIVPAKKLSDGRHRIRIAVAHRSQTRYISTQFILDSASQLRKGRVVKHENAANINACLGKIISEYEEILSCMPGLHSLSCTEVVHALIRERQKRNISFRTVAQEYLSFMDNEERRKSYKLYGIACSKLQRYMKGDFLIVQLKPTHIQGFADWMRQEGLTETSIRIYLTLVKVILNYAGKMNYVNYTVHPFVLFKMPACAVRELDLSVEELRKIRDVKLCKDSQIMARDVFMLTYYLGGINLRDLMEYDFTDHEHMRYVRHKTRNSKKKENEIAFTIQPEAKEIIERYLSDSGRLSFGRYSSYEKVYSLVFRHISSIARLAGISRQVSYYSARKTFAQHGYDIGIDIEKIEYCIGHSMKNNRPIFNYIRVMQEHADKVFRAIFDRLKEG